MPTAAFDDSDHVMLADLPGEWWFDTEPGNVLYDRVDTYGGWKNNDARPNLDEEHTGWQRLAIGDFWENLGVPYDGVAWYRVRITPPPSVAGRRLWLWFSGIAGKATYLRGPGRITRARAHQARG